jgi:hypothetical protein
MLALMSNQDPTPEEKQVISPELLDQMQVTRHP